VPGKVGGRVVGRRRLSLTRGRARWVRATLLLALRTVSGAYLP